ncbi:hypothetical protein Tco_1347174 [Tanacetum coccineum]
MENLSSADLVYDEARPSYDSDILFEVPDHDNYQDVVCEHHEVHEMHDDVHQNYVVDSHADYTSDNNMILYDQYRKVAIGYKNPLCLNHAKQVQPPLYNGHEIVKTNHVPAIVHNSEETLEIAEITRKKMNEKMKDPEYVKKKVKIAPHDYSKDNYLATFTPQKQLTPEQIFWSNDLIKMKVEALKEQTTASRPIKALTVYPPNTPATLVPRVLPTKSQVKWKGALTKEVKEMKEIFEELEAEVDQNAVHRKHDEIEQKNLLIANGNLIADCLYAIDVEPIPPRNRNNKEVHLDYLKHLKESVETLHKIIEEAKVERPLDRSLASACLYTKHS